MIAMVWYCLKCRMVLRCVPLLIARDCKCAVPQLGRPTRVTWDTEQQRQA